MRKKWMAFLGCFVFALLLTLAGKPDEALAASYQTARTSSEYYTKEERTANGVTFEYVYSARVLYATKNGKQTKVYKAPKGYSLSGPVLTDGSSLYFVAAADSGKNCLFYQSTITGKNRKEIADVYAGWPEIAGCYKGKIYYRDGSGEGNLICLNVAKGKTKIVYEGSVLSGSLAQNGRYIYFGTSRTICRYDAQTGKTKKIVTRYATVNWSVVIYDASSDYLYYTTVLKESESGGIVSVNRCKPDGSHKKTVVKKLNAGEPVISLTSKSISYLDKNGKIKTKKF